MSFFSDLWRNMILREETSKEKGYISGPEKQELLGRTGVVMHELRPAGTILIDEVPVDVVSEGEFIKKYRTVKVIDVTGNRILVREV